MVGKAFIVLITLYFFAVRLSKAVNASLTMVFVPLDIKAANV